MKYFVQVNKFERNEKKLESECGGEQFYDNYFSALASAKEIVNKIACTDRAHIFQRTSRWDIFDGICKTHEVRVVMQDNGKELFPICFYPAPYVSETYNINAQIYGYKEQDLELAFSVLCFARKHEDGTYESFLKRDSGREFELGMAHAILNDSNVEIVSKGRLCTKSDGNFETVTDYCLPLKNNDCVVFKPTVFVNINNAINVKSRFQVESLFVFDDGYIVPVLSDIQVHGMSDMNMKDIIDDIIDSLSWDFDIIQDFFSSSKNYIETESGFNLIASSYDGGTIELEFFSDDRCRISDIKRAIMSFRIIDYIEEIA